MTTFENLEHANACVAEQTDVYCPAVSSSFGTGMTFESAAYLFRDGSFTNSYDLSFHAGDFRPRLKVASCPTVLGEIAGPEARAAINGGFFFLADRASAEPRHTSLNFIAVDGEILNLPVDDKETLLINKYGAMQAQKVRALGTLSMNGEVVRWAGAKTQHDAPIILYGNGCAQIQHQPGGVAGTQRVLLESSRFTPPIQDRDVVDVGFVKAADGRYFVDTDSASDGGLDIFNHDMVLRVPRDLVAAGDNTVEVMSVDTVCIDDEFDSAISIGPLIDAKDIVTHPINRDMSLGTRPPFIERPMARSVLYETSDGVVHMRVFDGRPDSEQFKGVTPQMVQTIISREAAVSWGCFLDPGNSAKLWLRDNDSAAYTYGNRHYIRWPSATTSKFTWVPDEGRRIGSALVVE